MLRVVSLVSKLQGLIAATHQHAHALSVELANLRRLNATRRAELQRLTEAHRGMSVSEAGLHLIEGFEGFRSEQYDDGTGTMTIGYGTTAADVSPLPHHLSQSQAEDLLRRKLQEVYVPSIKALGVGLTQHQVDALASFVYNLGPGVIGPGTTMGRLLRSRQFRAAADHMLLFDRAGGRQLPGLHTRRVAERLLFLS